MAKLIRHFGDRKKANDWIAKCRKAFPFNVQGGTAYVKDGSFHAMIFGDINPELADTLKGTAKLWQYTP